MAGLMDMLFKLTPIEPNAEPDNTLTANTLTANTANIIPDSVQLQIAEQPEPDVSQVDTPEDASAPEWVSRESVNALLEERDKVIADLSAKVDMLIKYRPQPSQQTEQPTTPPVTPDAPSDYVPLKELDFVTRDGKF